MRTMAPVLAIEVFDFVQYASNILLAQSRGDLL